MNDPQELLLQLRDIHTPQVSAVPALAWWILLAACLLIAWIGYALYKRYLRYGWKREAKAELSRLRAQAGTVPVAQTLSGTSKLIRRVVLAVRPRHNVAALEGQAWLAELDDICGKSVFSDGFGKLLEYGPYQRQPEIGKHDLNALMDVVGSLIDSAGREFSRGAS